MQMVSGGASFTFRKLMIFIDGSNFLGGVADIKLKTGKVYKIDYPLLEQFLVGNASKDGLIRLEHIKTYFYGPKGVPEDLKSLKFGIQFSEQIEEFKNDLIKNHVRVILKDKIKNKEKGVDAALVTDFLSLAYSGAYDYAVLVSGDADFISAIDEVKRYGKMISVICFESRFNEALTEHVDKVVFIPMDSNILKELK